MVLNKNVRGWLRLAALVTGWSPGAVTARTYIWQHNDDSFIHSFMYVYGEVQYQTALALMRSLMLEVGLDETPVTYVAHLCPTPAHEQRRGKDNNGATGLQVATCVQRDAARDSIALSRC